MAAQIHYTADMVRAMPDDGNKYEVVRGELLVSPSPRPWHEFIMKRLLVALDGYLTTERVGEVLGSRGDISWDAETLVQPDVYVVPLAEACTLQWEHMMHLLLVAEVLSPSSERADRVIKRRRYQEAGVPLYWVIDGDAHRVEIWTPTSRVPRVEERTLVWHPEGVTRPFTMELRELFRPV
jgi:Uma2 family endonuclease